MGCRNAQGTDPFEGPRSSCDAHPIKVNYVNESAKPN